MRTSIKCFLFFACLGVSPVFASHIVGGGFTYRYLGDTVVFGSTMQKYEITLELYQDCVTGVPEAINQDDPAYFTIYENVSSAPPNSDSIYYSRIAGSNGSISVPNTGVPTPCGNVWVENLPQLCLLRKRFVKVYYLPANSTGYTVVHQRCCRNASIMNILNPGDEGITNYCTIPPSSQHNKSATFNEYPPQVICLNQPAVFSHAATDADGDSLSYELCSAYGRTNGLDIKPKIADPPPYNPVSYYPPYTETNPIPGYPPISVNAVTGELTVTPIRVGRYLLAVACKEWRGGVLINTIMREFQWVVSDCGAVINSIKAYAGKNQSVLVGDKIQFHATGGTRYMWLPGNFLNNPYIADPVGTFTEPGEYTYVLNAVTDSGCGGSDTVMINVLEHSDFAVPNAFTPNGDGRNEVLIPMPIRNSILKSFSVYNRWGNRIFQTSSPGAGWDGTLNGTTQNPGVYSWAVEYTDNTGTTRTKSGNVILLR